MPDEKEPPKTVLFICVYNACRSRIGQAVARREAPRDWHIESAGLTPSDGVDKKAVQALWEHGLVMTHDAPKGLFPHPSGIWDCVVDISCVGAGADLPARRYVRWDLPDPMGGPPEVYEALFSEIEARVKKLIEELDSLTS